MKIYPTIKMANIPLIRYAFLMSSLFSQLPGKAQNSQGIRFVENDFNTLEEVKLAAKENNKYIFIDAYTTWCAPCKYMSQNIFPQKEVGDFFNEHFISIALQIDTTKKDNELVKRWYKDAQWISHHYEIQSYPTYLFIDDQGTLIHKIAGASNNKEEFLTKVRQALDPAMQYSKLVEDFKNGRSDSTFLLQLIHAAKNAGNDSLLHIAINSYLNTQNNLLTKQNILLIIDGTVNSKDKGFDILLKHPKAVDDVVGEGMSALLLGEIAFEEEIFPIIMPGGKITKYQGGLILYGGGEIDKQVDWGRLQTILKSKYDHFSEEILLKGKLKYYEWLEDWKEFNAILKNYRFTENNLDTTLINTMAVKLLKKARGKETFKDALPWSSVLISDQSYAGNLKVYSQVLYRAGKKRLSFHYMNEYLDKTHKQDISKKDRLEMIKGKSD